MSDTRACVCPGFANHVYRAGHVLKFQPRWMTFAYAERISSRFLECTGRTVSRTSCCRQVTDVARIKCRKMVGRVRRVPLSFPAGHRISTWIPNRADGSIVAIIPDVSKRLDYCDVGPRPFVKIERRIKTNIKAIPSHFRRYELSL